nr:hypothetical protein [Tanacetum cinerariifolium]
HLLVASFRCYVDVMATSERADRLLALEALAACLPFLKVVSLGPATVGGVIVVSELLLVFRTLV